MEQPEEIPTAHVLAFVGLDPGTWNMSQARRHYREAPQARPGVGRMFELDDVLAVTFFAELLHAGVSISTAGDVAGSLRRAMRAAPEAHTLYAVPNDYGRLHIVARPERGARVLLMIDVQDRRYLAAMAWHKARPAT